MPEKASQKAQGSGTVVQPNLRARLRVGFVVFGVLVAIEVTEYIVGVTMRGGAWPLLGILALIGAWPIVRYFMHIKQLWRPRE